MKRLTVFLKSMTLALFFLPLLETQANAVCPDLSNDGQLGCVNLSPPAGWKVESCNPGYGNLQHYFVGAATVSSGNTNSEVAYCYYTAGKQSNYKYSLYTIVKSTPSNTKTLFLKNNHWSKDQPMIACPSGQLCCVNLGNPAECPYSP